MIKPYMFSLDQLKDLLRENNVDIIETQGWYFVTDSFDRWTMLDGICYLNGIALDKKQVQEYIKNPPKPKKRNMLKMMRAKDYFDQEEVYDECSSVEIGIE